MNKTRVLIVGLDGATFDIIRPMVEEGRLPTFAKLMKEGVYGDLRSTILPVTPPAWASFMTGKNPGKHGAFGFYSYRDNSYETELATGLTIKAKKIWQYLDPSKKVGLIDIPLTFPPEKINGCMISGMPVPSEKCIFTYPPELHTEILSEIGDYMIDRDLMEATRSDTIDSLKRLYSYTEMRKNAAEYLIKNKGPFDFFMVVFRSTDFIQHAAFKYLDTEYTSVHPEETEKFGDVICQVYKKMDRYVEQLIKLSGEECTTVIMSDHGGGPLKRRFHLNRWLKKEGFLVLKNNSPRGLRIRKKKISEILNRVSLNFINAFLPERLKSLRLPIPRPYRKHPIELVDWKRTKAYANLVWTDGVIRINLQQREPDGIVDESEYEKLKKDLIIKLKEITDPDNGQKVIESAFTREEVYAGPFVHKAPDILLLTRNMEYAFTATVQGEELFETPADPIPATHRMDGIFMISGPNIEKGKQLQTKSILDIAPTILYLMGNPVPEDMDGKVITDAIQNGYQDEHPIVYGKAEDTLGFSQETVEFSEEEKREIEVGLRGLGYME
jgi:predicted AlkP superfamily phosphohydrolase/phosphomutase